MLEITSISGLWELPIGPEGNCCSDFPTCFKLFVESSLHIMRLLLTGVAAGVALSREQLYILQFGLKHSITGGSIKNIKSRLPFVKYS